jgi:hypothetical protein
MLRQGVSALALLGTLAVIAGCTSEQSTAPIKPTSLPVTSVQATADGWDQFSADVTVSIQGSIFREHSKPRRYHLERAKQLDGNWLTTLQADRGSSLASRGPTDKSFDSGNDRIEFDPHGARAFDNQGRSVDVSATAGIKNISPLRQQLVKETDMHSESRSELGGEWLRAILVNQASREAFRNRVKGSVQTGTVSGGNRTRYQRSSGDTSYAIVVDDSIGAPVDVQVTKAGAPVAHLQFGYVQISATEYLRNYVRTETHLPNMPNPIVFESRMDNVSLTSRRTP